MSWLWGKDRHIVRVKRKTQRPEISKYNCRMTDLDSLEGYYPQTLRTTSHISLYHIFSPKKCIHHAEYIAAKPLCNIKNEPSAGFIYQLRDLLFHPIS